MKKLKVKKFLAATVSAATIFSSTASVCTAPATAADDQNYAEALALSLYFFDANQCGTEVNDNCLTWRGNCHTYDAEASLDNAKNLGSSEKEKIKAANGGKNTVDVSGGYHDAGDHVKFNLTMAFSAYSLAMADYMNPGAYEKAGCKDHYLYILRETCDYFMKTTFLDDSGEVYAVCATVSDESDHSTWTPPEVQSYTRPTYWLTTGSNNSAISADMASAFAGAAYSFKDSDPAYSAECLKYAKALYSFAQKNPGLTNNPNGNMYNLDDTYIDELALAQAWLYINGEAALPSYKPTGNGCYNNQYYDYHLYCWGKKWSGYAALMYSITGDQAYASEMQFELNNKGGCPENKYNAEGWGASRYNCALQMVSLGLANGDANSSYAKGAKYQMDYLLGNNSFGYSFLMGYGSKWPTHIHHRAANPGNGNQTSVDNPDSKYVLYGALVGGCDSSGNYEDHADRYQFTEPALDYNGCFALACAGLVNLYGGDASAVKDIVKNASEIDENFVFGNSDKPDPTEPSTNPPDPTEPSTTPPDPTEPSTNPPDPTEPSTNPPDPTEPSTNPPDPTEPNTDVIPDSDDYGNVNEDDDVNVADVVKLNMYLLDRQENALSEKAISNSDVARNDVIDLGDSAFLMSYVVETITRDKLGKR